MGFCNGNVINTISAFNARHFAIYMTLICDGEGIVAEVSSSHENISLCLLGDKDPLTYLKP